MLEEKHKCQETIIIGDFNMHPFDVGMTDARYLNAVMCRSVASKGSRTVDFKTRRYYYNPMWNFLGDQSRSQPASYFYTGSDSNNIHWCSMDQMIIRPSLIDCLVGNGVQILTEAGPKSLTKDKGVPDVSISDHLPILATLNCGKKTNAR
jgi:hypothetical protein